MPTIQVEAHVSKRDLLKAVEQLDPEEFQHFVADVLTLRARRQPGSLPASETALLLTINQGLPEDLRQRYRELIDKRRHEALTPQERAELLRLTDQVEEREASRASALAELARLRGMSLAELMSALGIQAPAHK